MLLPMAKQETYRDGQIVFKAGDADIDFFVVEDGSLEIINPADENRTITVHEPGEFADDIDLLTRRPVIVTAGGQRHEVDVHLYLRSVLAWLPVTPASQVERFLPDVWKRDWMPI